MDRIRATREEVRILVSDAKGRRENCPVREQQGLIVGLRRGYWAYATGKTRNSGARASSPELAIHPNIRGLVDGGRLRVKIADHPDPCGWSRRLRMALIVHYDGLHHKVASSAGGDCRIHI